MRRPFALGSALALLGAVALWHPGLDGQKSGLLLGGLGGKGQEADALDRMSAYLEFDRGHLGVQVELPDPIGTESYIPAITVRKSAGDALPLAPLRTRWHYLSADLRTQIREALQSTAAPRWRRLAVHASGSASGNAFLLNTHHTSRQPALVDGAYHVVIGNGSFSPDGNISLGSRWHEQKPSAAMQIPDVNAISLSVCLIGDFTESGPNPAQWQALDELTAYLRAQLGPIDLVTHRELESTAPSCPGPGFSREMLDQLSQRTR